MRHCYFRILMGLIWMVAAVISGVNGNVSMAALYGALGVVFWYTAYTTWKNAKAGDK